MSFGPELIWSWSRELSALAGRRVQRVEGGGSAVIISLAGGAELLLSWGAQNCGAAMISARDKKSLLAAARQTPPITNAVKSHLTGAQLVSAEHNHRARPALAGVLHLGLQAAAAGVVVGGHAVRAEHLGQAHRAGLGLFVRAGQVDVAGARAGQRDTQHPRRHQAAHRRSAAANPDDLERACGAGPPLQGGKEEFQPCSPTAFSVLRLAHDERSGATPPQS